MTGFYKPDTELFAKQYWDRPPNKNQGDANVDITYRAVGHALSEWERMEEGLAQLYLAVTESDNNSTSPIKRGFGAIVSSGVRREVILAAAEAYFGQHWEDKEIRLSFYRVIEAVGFASRRRDDIAHGNVTIWREPAYGAFLLPANYNTERTKAYTYRDDDDPLYYTLSDFRFTGPDIDEIAAKFSRLYNAVIYLSGFIRKLDDGSILFVRAVKNDPVLKI